MRRGRPAYPDILTPREWEVLSLLREGLTNPQIAQRLGVTEGGAKFHVSEILSKLGVDSREEAVRLVDGRRHVLVALPFMGLLRLRMRGISGWRVLAAAAFGTAAAGFLLLLFGLGWLQGNAPGDEQSADAEAALDADAIAESLRKLEVARESSPYKHTILLSKGMPANVGVGADLIAEVPRVETLAELQAALSPDAKIIGVYWEPQFGFSDGVNLIIVDLSAMDELIGTTFLYEESKRGRNIMGLNVCVRNMPPFDSTHPDAGRVKEVLPHGDLQYYDGSPAPLGRWYVSSGRNGYTNTSPNPLGRTSCSFGNQGLEGSVSPEVAAMWGALDARPYFTIIRNGLNGGGAGGGALVDSPPSGLPDEECELRVSLSKLDAPGTGDTQSRPCGPAFVPPPG